MSALLKQCLADYRCALIRPDLRSIEAAKGSQRGGETKRGWGKFKDLPLHKRPLRGGRPIIASSFRLFLLD